MKTGCSKHNVSLALENITLLTKSKEKQIRNKCYSFITHLGQLSQIRFRGLKEASNLHEIPPKYKSDSKAGESIKELESHKQVEP
jgi:hypothetical protein